MAISSSWQFIGSLQSPWYRAFDALRRRLNRRLAAFLLGELARRGRDAVKPNKAGGQQSTETESLPSDAMDSPTMAAGSETIDTGDLRTIGHASRADNASCLQTTRAASGTQKAGDLRTIEAGSGPAFASSLLRRSPGVSLAVCLDIDRAALAEARRRDPSLAAVVGDLRRPPFRDGAFSLVFNNSTVEHLDEPLTAVREMRRICHDDGIVYVGVPYAWGPLFFQPLLRRTRIGVWLGPVFTKASLERLIRQAGLRPLRFRTFFWRFFVGVTASPWPQETATPRICDTRVQPSA